MITVFPAARAGNLPRGEEEGKVPGHDRSHHTHGMAQGEGKGVVPELERLAVNLVAQPA